MKSIVILVAHSWGRRRSSSRFVKAVKVQSDRGTIVYTIPTPDYSLLGAAGSQATEP